MNKSFTINVEMEERWVDDFCSMLKEMERLGDIGSSKFLAFYSDGDGDFRPKFNFDTNCNKTQSDLKRIDAHIYDVG